MQSLKSPINTLLKINRFSTIFTFTISNPTIELPICTTPLNNMNNNKLCSAFKTPSHEYDLTSPVESTKVNNKMNVTFPIENTKEKENINDVAPIDLIYVDPEILKESIDVNLIKSAEMKDGTAIFANLSLWWRGIFADKLNVSNYYKL